jgi:hypothetical protein
MGEQLRNGWAIRRRLGLESALWERTEHVDQNGIVAIPRLEQSLKKRFVW